MACRVRASIPTLLAFLAMSLSGCDDPHFDGKQYEITHTSHALTTLANGTSFMDGGRWLYKASDYVPGFCGPASTTTRGPGGTVEIDWHQCLGVGVTDFVGSFRYDGGGVYEGLIDVTTDPTATGGTPMTFTSLIALEPR